MIVSAAWNNLPAWNVYLGSFVEVLICYGLFLADCDFWKINDDYVLLMNGSCAWWVNEPGLFNHPGLW